jgi:hypothetical protein
MSIKNQKLAAAKKIAAKVKTKKAVTKKAVTKKAEVKQTSPQSPSYKRVKDSEVSAKPVGWRYKGNNYNTPSDRVIAREKAKPREDRSIYFETRKDKSDKNFYDKLEEGGTLGAGSFKKGGAFSGRQYDPYNEPDDKGKHAKPVGYRFTDKRAKRLGESPYETPTPEQVQKYRGKGVYFEARQDKSDRSYSRRLEEGGTLGAGSFKKGGAFSGRQYDPYNEPDDKGKHAKPVGYRFTDKRAKRLGESPYETPTPEQVQKYRGKGVYFEARQDKSDRSYSRRLEEGGTFGAGSFARGGRAGYRPQYVPNKEIVSMTLRSGKVIKNDSIYDGAYVSKSLKLAEGGTMGAGSFARGGVERIANTQARDYSENLIPFKGANLEGKVLDNGDYVVLSYGYYPIWWFCKKEGKWYGNATKYSVTISKQMSQSRPDYNAVMLSKNDLLDMMMKHNSTFEDGGLLDNILGNVDGASVSTIGGTGMLSADLTPQMDILNPSF